MEEGKKPCQKGRSGGTVAHEGACAKLCYESANCTVWSFNMDDSNCWLKTTADCFGSNPNFIWGTKQCGGIETKLKNFKSLVLSLCFLCLFLSVRLCQC